MVPVCQLCGGRAQKMDTGFCPPFCQSKNFPPAPALMPDTSVPPSMPLVPFKLLLCCRRSEGVNLGKSMCGFFKGNYLGLQKFLPLTQFPLVLQPEVMGTYLPGSGTQGLGAWCGAGTLCSLETLPKFLSTICGCGTSLFRDSAFPTSLDGCGFLNSAVVGLPVN